MVSLLGIVLSEKGVSGAERRVELSGFRALQLPIPLPSPALQYALLI